jgi:hypothetical protein
MNGSRFLARRSECTALFEAQAERFFRKPLEIQHRLDSAG